MTVPPAAPHPVTALDDQMRRFAAAYRVLACEFVLLGLTVQSAWFEAWAQPLLDAAEARAAALARRARRDRLVRRGVPAHLAGQALRLVPRGQGPKEREKTADQPP
ncbi:hypothetical protein DA075_15475 [Methylobacterium currus]|uniref:Uncharacterized protein n=1 Tax=Methylobacterium currus TaxID=2051553 RepID=A0A2R4WKS7_9HYPH|nr:hypothetical protein [Methylobacterium currus]AWB22152.1 hypothetical protein DA075_15475 [Methylobacterium currus]UHC18220.1 hypothetical protein LRS73_10455 [Methylobacterium currus]